MQIKFIEKKNLQFSIFFILCSLIFIMCIPILQHGFVPGDDYEYHLSRIQGIADTMQGGVFPAKIHTFFYFICSPTADFIQIYFYIFPLY